MQGECRALKWFPVVHTGGPAGFLSHQRSDALKGWVTSTDVALYAMITYTDYT